MINSTTGATMQVNVEITTVGAEHAHALLKKHMADLEALRQTEMRLQSGHPLAVWRANQDVAGQIQAAAASKAAFESFEKQRRSVLGITAAQKDAAEQAKLLAAVDPLNQWDKSFRKMVTVFQRVRDALLSFMVINMVSQGIQEFFTKLVQANAQIEMLDTRLARMNISAEGIKTLKDSIVQLTLQTPFVIKDFTDAAVQLEAFGISAEKNLKPISDWASAMGRDLADMTTAFSKIAIGSPRTTLLLTTRGIRKEEFDAELKVTHDRVLALSNVIEKKFSEMAKATSNTFLGMIANIQDAWFLLAKQIGGPLFEKMRSDVGRLFIGLKDALGGDVAGKGSLPIKILGETIGYLYSVIKMSLPMITAFLGAWAIRGTAVGIMWLVGQFQGMIRNVSTLGAAFTEAGQAIRGFGLMSQSARISLQSLYLALAPVIAIASVAFMGIYSFLGDMERAGVDSAAAIAALNDEMITTDGKIQALKVSIASMENATGGFFSKLWAGILDIASARGRAMHGGLPGQLEMMDILEKELAREKDILSVLQAQEEERKRMLRLTRESLSTVDALAISEMVKKKQGGEEVLEAAKKQVAAQLLDADKAYTNATKLANESDAKFKQRKEGLLDVLQTLRHLQKVFTEVSLGPEVLKGKVVTETLSNMDTIIKSISLGRDQALGAWKEILGDLPDEEKNKTKGKVEKDISAWFTKIAEMEARFASLSEGEPRYAERIKGNLAKMMIERVRALSTIGGAVGIKAYMNFITAAVSTYEELNKWLEAIARNDEKLQNAQRHRYDAEREAQEALLSAEKARIDYEYERSGRLEDVRAEKQMQLFKVTVLMKQAEMELAKAKDKVVNGAIAEAEKMAAVAEVQKSLNGLTKDYWDILKEIYALPSTDFVMAWEKAMKRLQDDINAFYDTLSDSLVSGLRDFAVGVIKDFVHLFSATDERTADLLAAQEELSQLQNDSKRNYVQVEKLRRSATETNEEYLSRMKMQEQLTNANVMQYEAQTKEAELMTKINQLEAERNNLLLDRLRILGEKIFDTVLTGAVNVLMHSIGIGGGGESNGPSLPVPEPVPENPLTSINFYGDVYGMEDFSQKVDLAVRENSRRRSG
jgi:hypothetical protein